MARVRATRSACLRSAAVHTSGAPRRHIASTPSMLPLYARGTDRPPSPIGVEGYAGGPMPSSLSEATGMKG